MKVLLAGIFNCGTLLAQHNRDLLYSIGNNLLKAKIIKYEIDIAKTSVKTIVIQFYNLFLGYIF